MNYTQEDLTKIKQLVATTDMNNVRVGIQIAKGLGITAEILANLFTIDDVVLDKRYDNWRIDSFGFYNWSMESKERCYSYYVNKFDTIQILFNE